jgi:phage shock protein C
VTKTTHTTLYRDPEGGKFTGVCAGIADYTGTNPFWVRLGLLVSWCTPLGAVTFPAYLLCWMLLSKKPPHLYQDKQEQQYWQGVRQNPRRTVREVRARFRDVDRRLADVEHYYVSSNPRLSDEIERLR